MNIDITWTITAVIAVSSFLSPIAVSIINNKHQAKIRKLELEHDTHARQLELYNQAIAKQFDVYYADKREAFSEFVKNAGVYSMGKQSTRDYECLHSALEKALLFCNVENQTLMINFLNYVDTDAFGGGFSQGERTTYSKYLTEISLSLNKELESTKPVIDCESSKH